MSRTRRSTLGGWLAFWIGVANAVGILAYAGTAALVMWIDEVNEDDGDSPPDGFDSEDAEELVTQVGLALAVAAPVSILLTILGTRWLTRRATARIDAVITTAARMSAEDLEQRLPVSNNNDELDELARALNALFARISGSVAAQRQFAADASHELRSPLTVLASTLEVARRRPRSASEWEGFADQALAEVQHMSTLVDGLLLLARAGTLRRVRHDLGALVDSIGDRWHSLASDAGITLQTTTVQLTTDLDPRMLELAVGNLLGNALAHAPAGTAIQLTLTATADAALLHVDDAGPGVPPGERERIFTPFVHRDAPAADRVAGRPGLGLGLAIARRIVEAHDGSISVHDAPIGGARFTIQLPRS